MAYLDTVELASFAGIKFPWSHIRFGTRVRFHEHEMRHTDGASIEKQGLKLWTFKFSIPFDENLNPRYRNLLTLGRDQLMAHFKASDTGTLFCPSFGTINAFADSWDEELEPKRVRSGTRAEISFTQDMETAFLLDNLVAQASDVTSLLTTAQSLLTAAGTVMKPSLIAQIGDFFDKCIQARDQVDLIGNVVAAKVDAVTIAINQIDQTVNGFRDPTSWPVLQACLNVASSVQQLSADLGADTEPQLRTWRTPFLMAIPDVSQAIYKDTSHVFDLLSLNALDDAFAIPANTTIKYLTAI